jgi:hypothetical protein
VVSQLTKIFSELREGVVWAEGFLRHDATSSRRAGVSGGAVSGGWATTQEPEHQGCWRNGEGETKYGAHRSVARKQQSHSHQQDHQ